MENRTRMEIPHGRGVSGAGKSTIIEELKKLDGRFSLIQAYTTRAQREHETDKLTRNAEEIRKLNKEGKIFFLNELYGNVYGTPKDLVEFAMKLRLFPISDAPIDKAWMAKEAFPKNTFLAYILPPNIEILQKRLDGRIASDERLQNAKDELKKVEEGRFDHIIDIKIVNRENKQEAAAKCIYNSFMEVVRRDSA